MYPSREQTDSPVHTAYSTSPVKPESQRILMNARKPVRSISKVPYKVLDAPELADDFYLNLVDWSNQDVLGVGLGKCVYLWSAKTSNVTKLCELPGTQDSITGLNWAERGNHLAIGTQSGLVQIWDVEKEKLLRTMMGHSARVGALAWNNFVLTTGSRDRIIYHRDVRVPEHHVKTLLAHRQEVCGLRWNPTREYLASGGNDNKLLVWDGVSETPLYRFNEHTAAVKAIAWSPHQQGLLASGGGTADMKIRFWNTQTGVPLSVIDTGSQVCNLAWNKASNEIISTHGYSSGQVHNQIQLWRYPSLSQVATLTGHTMRVLYLAMSPSGKSIVTGAGDETLRFWDLNTPARDALDKREDRSVQSSFVQLR
ncbi:substrate-specific activator of APC-dependent proteolysis [Malassezia obtusa]|uniref:Substrate-specific activator of APC-dependent proteolysis n=1 Tax=Malassezia obtusa TaxID=76774 RepID=A0AAF0ITG4_9BASI|nr:substrate-specific activator of APC-dependent proteolysis [Malassezia obtusa]